MMDFAQVASPTRAPPQPSPVQAQLQQQLSALQAQLDAVAQQMSNGQTPKSPACIDSATAAAASRALAVPTTPGATSPWPLSAITASVTQESSTKLASPFASLAPSPGDPASESPTAKTIASPFGGGKWAGLRQKQKMASSAVSTLNELAAPPDLKRDVSDDKAIAFMHSQQVRYHRAREGPTDYELDALQSRSKQLLEECKAHGSEAARRYEEEKRAAERQEAEEEVEAMAEEAAEAAEAALDPPPAMEVREAIREVIMEVEVTKEVPVEVIKYVEREVIKEVPVPIAAHGGAAALLHEAAEKCSVADPADPALFFAEHFCRKVAAAKKRVATEVAT